MEAQQKPQFGKVKGLLVLIFAVAPAAAIFLILDHLDDALWFVGKKVETAKERVGAWGHQLLLRCPLPESLKSKLTGDAKDV